MFHAAPRPKPTTAKPRGLSALMLGLPLTRRRSGLGERRRRLSSLALVVAVAVLGITGAWVHPVQAIGEYPDAPWAVPTTGTVGFTWMTNGHQGIDICNDYNSGCLKGQPGTKIYAAGTGKVIRLLDACDKEAGPGTGNPNPPERVLVRHPSNPLGLKATTDTLYGHMALADPTKTTICSNGNDITNASQTLITVTKDQSVDWTTPLGTMGTCCSNDNTSVIAHLHFQVNLSSAGTDGTQGCPVGQSSCRVDPTPYITGYRWGAGVPVPSGTHLTYNGNTQDPPLQGGGNSQADNATLTASQTNLTVAPGQTFSVQFSATNTGKTTWTAAEGFGLDRRSWSSGVEMGTPTFIKVPSTAAVKTGQTQIFTVNFTAPIASGSYIQTWQMLHANAQRNFGNQVALTVKVEQPGTQRNLIRDCDIGGCTASNTFDMQGPTVGSVTYFLDSSGALHIQVRAANGAGAPNMTFIAYLVCGPSHDTACGYIEIGTLTTNASGGVALFEAVISKSTLQVSFGPAGHVNNDHVDFIGSDNTLWAAAPIQFTTP